jgi:hypothetical protein
MMLNSKTPQPDRRAVLKGAVGIAALAGSLGVSAQDTGLLDSAKEQVNKAEDSDAWLAQADESFFAAHIGSHFEFWSARGRAAASLRNVQTITDKRKSPDHVQAFSLEFVIEESTRTIPSDLCYVTHAKLGTFELFVVEARTDRGAAMLIATLARTPAARAT